MTGADEVRMTQRVVQFARFAVRRVCAMAGVWALLGVFLGFNCDHLAQGNRVGLVANVLAWIIVMGITGALMSFFGGRPFDSWIGAAGGMVIAVLVEIPLPQVEASPLSELNFGAVAGAVVAATCWPWVRIFIAVTHRLRNLRASMS